MSFLNKLGCIIFLSGALLALPTQASMRGGRGDGGTFVTASFTLGAYAVISFVGAAALYGGALFLGKWVYDRIQHRPQDDLQETDRRAIQFNRTLLLGVGGLTGGGALLLWAVGRLLNVRRVFLRDAFPVF